MRKGIENIVKILTNSLAYHNKLIMDILREKIADGWILTSIENMLKLQKRLQISWIQLYW